MVTVPEAAAFLLELMLKDGEYQTMLKDSGGRCRGSNNFDDWVFTFGGEPAGEVGLPGLSLC